MFAPSKSEQELEIKVENDTNIKTEKEDIAQGEWLFTAK